MRRLALSLCALLGVTALAAVASAQSLDPTPDTTPAIELDGSIPSDAELVFDGTTWFVTDELGSRSGESLFHSFGRFNVPAGQIAEFSARVTPERPVLPERVFARVTWGDPSEIRGTLRSTIEGADLYLMNPAGVSFEGGARLEVDGSFHVSSAGRIDFGAGQSFTASPADPPPVLTIEEPARYGFLPGGGGPIEFGLLEAGPFSVKEGRTLSAVGGDVKIRSDDRRFTFSAPGSLIVLIAGGPGLELPFPLEAFDPAAVDPSLPLGEVSLLASRIAASLPAGSIVIRGGKVTLESSAIGVNHDAAVPSRFEAAVDVAARGELVVTGRGGISTASRGADGREIRLAGDRITISSDSELLSRTSGSNAGSKIVVRGGSLYLLDGGRLRSLSSNQGTGGAIDVRVSELTLLRGGRIVSEATGAGTGGSLRIRSATLEANDAGYSVAGTVIQSTTGATADGDAGSIEVLVAERIELRDGAQIFSRTEGSGDAGSVRVEAPEIELSGRILDPSDPEPDPLKKRNRPSLIETRARPGSSGYAGQPLFEDDILVSVLGVSIEADSLRVLDGADVGTATQGSGASGDLEVHARDSVLLQGGPNGPATLQSRASASIGSPDVGAGGQVWITTPALSLLDGGQITSATTGTGDAGTVDLDVGRLEIRGRSSFGESGLFAQTLAPALADAGSAGGVNVVASGDVEIADGARISVETSNANRAGDVAIDAGGRVIVDAATISAQATDFASAPGGSISITADGGIELRNGALIEARSLGAGDAGSIRLAGGPILELSDSTVGTEAEEAGGGRIFLIAEEQILLTDSTVDTSVATGKGDGGNVSVDPELLLLNRSGIHADAIDGNGGVVVIRAGSFVRSAGSAVTADAFGEGNPGIVAIESPEADLASERAQPAQEFLDAAGLLRTACGGSASQASSFVVERVAGLPASPEGPLPAPLWDALAASDLAGAGSGAPALAEGSAARLPAAALAGGCSGREGSG
jgi:filamentous hemagglutinin family protein